ncbi:laminin EGF-like protein, partial [Cooperia oncophora]
MVQDGNVKLNGTITIHNCPFATFCREVVTDAGKVAMIPLAKGPATVQMHVPPRADFGLAAVNLIAKKEWNNEYLQQVPVCVRKDGRCVPQQYPPAAYRYCLAYCPSVELDVRALNQRIKKSQRLVRFLAISSQIPVGLMIKRSIQIIQFWMEDKYTATLYHNNTQKGPIFIDSITAVPFHSYSENLMRPLPIDLSSEFIQQCSADFYQNDPDNVTDFCRDKIFSLTTDFNAAAFSCDCNPKVLNLEKCKCSIGQQCNEQTGQCFCPPHVEGTACDKCVSYAFGYDPLIGCQKENVAGPACDTCKSGTFHLSAENPKGCINCFCFGTTDQCRSSMFPVSISSVDMSMFTTNDPAGTLEFENDVVSYTAGDNSTASVYFNVPIEHGADYTASYGLLMFSFSFSCTSNCLFNHLTIHPRMSADADVRLYGNNMTAEFWAPEQPADPKEAFNVRVKLVPVYVSIVNTALMEIIVSCVKRDIMEMQLMAAHTPACHASVHSHLRTTLLLDVRCDAGFFGEPQRPGGSCQPCHCNDNNNLTDSRACHPITGDCYLCERNTDGRHCEYCAQCLTTGVSHAVVDVTHATVVSLPHLANVTTRPVSANVDQELLDCAVSIANMDSGIMANTAVRSVTARRISPWVRSVMCVLASVTVKEGATGARCDQCLQSYLRIPTYGCRRCDECVHHLVSDVDHLGLHMQNLNMSIGNISSATVVGAR